MQSNHPIVAKINGLILQLESFRGLILSGDYPEIGAIEPPNVAEKLKNRICLQCGKAVGKRRVRGCHDTCYKRVMDLIKEGEITEQEAIAAGELAAVRIVGRPKKTSSINELVAARKKAAALAKQRETMTSKFKDVSLGNPARKGPKKGSAE